MARVSVTLVRQELETLKLERRSATKMARLHRLLLDYR